MTWEFGGRELEDEDVAEEGGGHGNVEDGFVYALTAKLVSGIRKKRH